VGALFCVAGVLALFEIIYSFSQNRINLNFAVLLLPIGIGLLMGKSGARWWARISIYIGYLLLAISVLTAIFSIENVYFVMGDTVLRGAAAMPFYLFILMLIGALLTVVKRVLYSAKASEFFVEKEAVERANEPVSDFSKFLNQHPEFRNHPPNEQWKEFEQWMENRRTQAPPVIQVIPEAKN
jgi:hypothetical protein